MNPKDPVRTTYENGVDENGELIGDANDKSSQYYSERTILNDGTIVIKVYERHTNRLVNTSEAAKPNPDQAKIWAEQRKQVASPPTEEPNPSDPTKTRIWDPSLNNGQGGWKEGVPIAQKPGTSAAPPPTRPKPENPQIYQTWDSDQRVWVDSGPIAQKPPDTAKPPTEEPDPSDPTKTRIWDPTLNDGQGGWKPGVAIAQKPTPLGQHGSIVSDSTEKREGKTVRVTKYEDGFEAVASVTEESGVDEPPGAPPLDLTPGQGISSLDVYKTWLAGQTGLTPAQRTALLQQRIDLLVAAAKEQAGVAGISAGVMGEQGAEARSERAQANTRLSESQGTYRSALDYIQKTAKFQGRNGPKASDVMDYLLARGKQYAQEMGGTVNTPRNPVPTQLAPYYSVPGQAPAAGAPTGPGMPPAPTPAPVQAPGQPAPVPSIHTPSWSPQPTPEQPQVGPQPLYAAPPGMQPMPAPTQPPMPAAQPVGAFSELDEIMRRVLDPEAVDMANNTAILNMLSGTW